MKASIVKASQYSTMRVHIAQTQCQQHLISCPAEQAESVSSNTRGHQQLGGRPTWWSPLAKLAAKLMFALYKLFRFFFCLFGLQGRCLLLSSKKPSRTPDKPEMCRNNDVECTRRSVHRKNSPRWGWQSLFFLFIFFLGREGYSLHKCNDNNLKSM